MQRLIMFKTHSLEEYVMIKSPVYVQAIVDYTIKITPLTMQYYTFVLSPMSSSPSESFTSGSSACALEYVRPTHSRILG